MPRGGRRPGAGRPKGARNKASARLQAEVASSGVTPLAYLLAILRDETETTERRMEAAVKAAPFVHPRMTAVDVNGTVDGSLTVEIVRFAD